MIMIHTQAKYQGQRSGGSKVRMVTNGRTNRWTNMTEFITSISTQSVIKVTKYFLQTLQLKEHFNDDKRRYSVSP